MASGYVDWHKRTYTDIIAQSIEKILVDIASASIGQVPIDVKANSVGNIPIDIKANSVNELPVNITAQDLERMNIDIRAQTVERLIMSTSYGTPKYVRATGTIAPGRSETPIVLSTAGVLLAGYIFLYGSDKGEDADILLYLDGNNIAASSPGVLNDRSIDDENMYAFFIKKYDTTNNRYTLSLSRFITWDNNLSLTLINSNEAIYDLAYSIELFYAMR